MKKQRILAMLLSLAMIFTLVACGSSDDSVQESTNPGTSSNAPQDSAAPGESTGGKPVSTELVFGAPGPIGTYLYANNASTMDQMIWLVFDPIIYYHPVNREFTSDIVDYEYIDEYTLALTVKDGVTFTNGEALTAEDILFSIQSQTTAERASLKASFYTIFNYDKTYVSDDNKTLYLITDNVEAVALTNLYTPVYCKSWVEENGWDGENWYYAPNGTGPYTVSENVTGVYSVVAQKPEVAAGTYWNQEFKSDILTVKGIHYDDKNVMFIDVENGDIDMAFQIDSVDYARIAEDGLTHLNGVLLPYDDVQMMALDIDDGPTTDINLRAAIAHGVKWDEVAIAAWEDYGAPASSILASTMGDMYCNVGQYEYDPDLAKSYADKVTGSKEVTINIFSDNLYVQECEVIRAYLEQIGITLKVDVTDMATFFGNNMTGYGDVAFVRYPNGNFTAEPFLALSNYEATSVHPNQNLGADAEVCELMVAARQTLDNDKRAELYAELQQYMKDNYYAIPIAETYGAYVYNNTRWAGADIIATNAANLRFVYCLYTN